MQCVLSRGGRLPHNDPRGRDAWGWMGERHALYYTSFIVGAYTGDPVMMWRVFPMEQKRG